ncbi:hypothetical protein [Natrinema hispanicum]|uniref:Lipoprotein n=1 Tax=Natrinema hispanicum TaxID=392421 RepID=A0A1G6W6T4_9EURY|nr:hypothetical protein [Natrinema hispanicum]SDD60917.1 hypothetical protein SAMN05192552_103417 [Natrinema hispanicum]
MERRAFLTTVSVGLTTAVAGCTSQASPSEEENKTNSQPSTEIQDSTQTETKIGAEKTLIREGSTAERTLGTGSLTEGGLRTPHHVVLTNQTGETQTATFVIMQSDSSVLNEQFELESAATVVATLTDLGTYDTQVTVPKTDTTESVTIGPGQFSCNVTRTTVGMQADGSLDSTVLSTRMACPSVITEHVAAGGSTSYTLGDESVLQDTGKGTHNVMLRNPTDQVWTGRIIVKSGSTTQLDGVYTIEANGTVLLTLSESNTYQIHMSILETDTTKTEQVSPENFDCNQSSTRVVINNEGGLEAKTLSTLMACPDDSSTATNNTSS